MRALFAIAHKLSCAVYRVLTTGEPYKDLGAGYLDARDNNVSTRRLVARLKTIATLNQVASLLGLPPPPPAEARA